MTPRLQDVLHQDLAGRWALVIGDVMLDRYLWGKVERISPEAPVPVVLIERESECAGGAANVAANLAGLGLETRLLGLIGNDDNAARLTRALQSSGIGTDALLRAEQHPTITKTRIIGGHQQMMRLDRERPLAYTDGDVAAITAKAEEHVNARPALVILSDYGKGVLTATVCQAVITRCRRMGIPVLVDPKGRDYGKYRGATAITPNKREAAEACGVSIRDTAGLLSAARNLKRELQLDFMAVTRGEEGITLIADQEDVHLPATAQQVFDVSGAGDTVIATLGLGLVAGLPPESALSLANTAAGVVVGKLGTAPILKAELAAALNREQGSLQAEKIRTLDTLLSQVAQWRQRGEKIVFTNGCFDLLHAGHVTYLEKARALGDRLVLGLNTDRSVRALKGPTRPVIGENDRARVLAALESIDAVVLFDEDTPLTLIRAIRPDVLAKGSDYAENEVVGGDDVKSWGGRVALVQLLAGRSTSRIINVVSEGG